MIYVGQIDKTITENSGDFKIKGPFLKMLRQLPLAFRNNFFVLSVPLDFNQV